MHQVKNMMLVTVWSSSASRARRSTRSGRPIRKDVGRATVLGFVGVLALLLLVNFLSYGLMT